MPLIDQLRNPQDIRRLVLHPLAMPGVEIIDNTPPTSDHPCWLVITTKDGSSVSVRSTMAEMDELASQLGGMRRVLTP